MQTFLQDSFKDFSDDSTIDEALEKLGMPDMNAKFADMTVQLMPHQILGVNFMLQKEKDLTKKGGLLCDAMGLGKVCRLARYGQSTCRIWSQS
jgi:SNF2 family DNA or RNA helicase